jgi:quercetin dioxygenase-like cupin family protein
MKTPPAFRVGELEIRFHVDPATTAGAVAVFESIIPAGARVPVPHRHVDYDETVYGLAGVCHFTLEGTEIALTAGASLFVPRGQLHGFVNRGPETTRVLVVVTPGRLGPDYFREVAEIVNAGGPPDRAKIAALMARHGMVAA